jgi:membrane-associated protease RseP (regulator of RpoE activity)
MRKVTVMLICVFGIALSVARAEPIDDENSYDETRENYSEARTAHHELRDAVAKIREYYSQGYNVFRDGGLVGLGSQVRLGIILGAAWDPAAVDVGAFVIGVTPGGPAEEAGLVAGDVITSFNGEDLVDESDSRGIDSTMASRKLVELSRALEEGEKVTLEYERDGTSHRVDLIARRVQFDPEIMRQYGIQKLGGTFPEYAYRIFPGGGKWFLPRAWLDMELVALNPELGEYFGADSGVLVVRGPEQNDPLGLKSGDVIISIGGREVRSPEHAMRILRSYEPEETLAVQVVRQGRSQTLTGTVPESPIDFNFRWNVGDHWDSSED